MIVIHCPFCGFTGTERQVDDHVWARPALPWAPGEPHDDADDLLDADLAAGIGLDPTGRDLDPRFPHRLSTLTTDEWVRLSRYVRAGQPYGPQ
jgi:hypothetical protein